MWNENSDGTITYTNWENWGAPTDSLGSFYTTGVGAVSEEYNRVDALVLGLPSGSNAHPNLWMAYRVGTTGTGSWANWGQPGGGVNVYGTPSVASWGPGRWDVFIADTSNPVHLRQWYYDASCCTAWGDWGTLPVSGGMWGNGVSVIAMGENRLNMYVQGFTDANIYRRTYDYVDLGWSGSLGCSNPGSYVFVPEGTR
jgi:hypothetical protein